MCLPDTTNFKNASHSPLTEGSLTPPVDAASTFTTPVPGCPDSTTSDDSDQTCTSERLQSTLQFSCMISVQAEDPDALAHSAPSAGLILGGSVEITFEDDQDAGGKSSGQVPTTASLAPPPPPPDHLLSQGLQSLKFSHKPTIFIQYPGSAGSPRPREPSPRPKDSPFLSGRYAKIEGASRIQGPPDVRSTIAARPSTATGVRPPRPSSPKSQNAGTTQQYRHAQSEVDGSESVDRSDRYGTLHRRTQSVAAQRRIEFDTASSSQRMPNLRSMSRPGHFPGLDQGLIERALDFYLGSKSIDARDRDFAIDIHNARVGGFMNEEQFAHADSAGSASLRGRSSSSGRSMSSTHCVPALSLSDAAEMHRQSDGSRTVLWQEDSQIFGQQLRRSQSKEGFRGRRRSRDTSPINKERGSDASPSRESVQLSDSATQDGKAQFRTASRPQTARGQHSSAARRISPSHFRPRNGDTIRSVRDPSLGPPSDSEDEIIAEISFRRPPCRNCGSSSCGSRGATGPKSQNVVTSDVGLASDQENNVASPSKPMPPSPLLADTETTPTMDKYNAAYPDSVRLALQTSAEELSQLRAPSLSRASFRTLSSYEPSPVTPPPRHFEPRTPKAMVFKSDYALISIDPISSLRFEAADASLDNMISPSA